MKKLPNIYQGNFPKKINNNKKICYLKTPEQPFEEKREDRQTPAEIQQQIREIFSSLSHPYTIPVIIKTKEKVYETYLIAKNKNNIITLDNEIIDISDIESIKRKEH